MALRYFRVSALHPISQMIISLTHTLLMPFNQLCALLKLNMRRYDWACFMLIVMTELIKFFLMGLLFLNAMLPVSLIAVFTLAELIVEPCNLLFYALIVRIIMSWINPGSQQPLVYLAFLVTEPILSPLRRRLPAFAGFDFSPLIVIVVIKVITLFITVSLPLPLI